MALIIREHVTLHTGAKMPVMGLGTWQSTEEEVEKAVIAALDMGYRHIDTAFAYQNEEAIGRAVRKYIDSGKLKRSDLFITTKLAPTGMTPDRAPDFLRRSLANLGLDYVDLYLIHTPIGFNFQGDYTKVFTMKDGDFDVDMSTDLVGIWHALETEVGPNKKIRALGVSNYSPEQIERTNKAAKVTKVAVNQVEMNAYFQQKELVAFCRRHNIIVTSYASLGSPGRMSSFTANEQTEATKALMDHETVKEIARRHRVTPAQILLHHLAQQGIAVIPKSTNPARIALNYQVFNIQLTAYEKAELDKLDKGEDGRTFKMTGKVLQHPEYQYKK